MPDGTDDMYGSSQINIPPTFPYILKQYAKAAIRTQPYDLLKWSASYFRALAKGETPPIKDRLEYPPPDTPSGLSPGYLKVLIKQIGKGGTVTVSELVERWNGICLAEGPLHEMLAVGHFGETLDWLHFVAVAAGFLSNNLTQTMVLLCNLLTDEPEGGSALIPFNLFSKLYVFLAGLNCGDPLAEDEDDNDKREYILPDGKIFPSDKAAFLPESNISSTVSEQIMFLNSQDSFLSPDKTPVPSPCTTPPSPLNDSASSTTLTPQTLVDTFLEEGGDQNVCCEIVGPEVLHDGKIKGSPKKNQQILLTGDKSIQGDDSEEVLFKKNSSSPDLTPSAAALVVSSSKPSWDDCQIKDPQEENILKDGKSHVDAHYIKGDDPQVSGATTKSNYNLPSQHVPGIGPVVDPIQMQAVLDYLKGISLKQEGMVKPANIRHFLCPPLEKVPASQKTKV